MRLVTSLVPFAHLQLAGLIDEKNRVILKFVVDVDGVSESVRVMITPAEELQLDNEKPDDPAIAEVDVFAFAWSVENTSSTVKESFGMPRNTSRSDSLAGKYYSYLSNICTARGDVGIYVLGTQTDKTANISENDFQCI